MPNANSTGDERQRRDGSNSPFIKCCHWMTMDGGLMCAHNKPVLAATPKNAQEAFSMASEVRDSLQELSVWSRVVSW